MVLVLVWLVEQVSGFLDVLYGVLYLCLVLKGSDLLKREPRSCKVEQEDSCKSESEDESKGRVPVMLCFGGSEGGLHKDLTVNR